jgi:hypothetical protein
MQFYTRDGGAASTSITGRSLAGRIPHMTPVERAVLAAEILEGKVALVDVMAKTVAVLCGVSTTYVAGAAKLSQAERVEVLAGQRSLLEPNQPRPRHRAPAPAIDYAAELERILAEAINQIGKDPVLDAAVAAEQQAQT